MVVLVEASTGSVGRKASRAVARVWGLVLAPVTSALMPWFSAASKLYEICKHAHMTACAQTLGTQSPAWGEGRGGGGGGWGEDVYGAPCEVFKAGRKQRQNSECEGSMQAPPPWLLSDKVVCSPIKQVILACIENKYKQDELITYLHIWGKPNYSLIDVLDLVQQAVKAW